MSNVECVILFRNTSNGAVGYISDGESDKIAVYHDEESAIRDLPNIPILKAYPYQIVPLEEL